MVPRLPHCSSALVIPLGLWHPLHSTTWTVRIPVAVMADSQAIDNIKTSGAETEQDCSGKKAKLQGEEKIDDQTSAAAANEDVTDKETKTEGTADAEHDAQEEDKKEVEGLEATEDVKDKPPPQSATQHVYCEEWSKLSKEKIIDCIKGMVFGQAIGDALGLATEFMTKAEAKRYYKKKLSYDVIVQDFHRSRWDQSDWTDDTDQMLLIMLMLIEGQGSVNPLDFASRLHNWMGKGFPEFGDYGGMGIGATVSKTLTHPQFLDKPVYAAKQVWEASGRYLAANGAIMRTCILGALSFNDIPKVVANTVAIAEVTHADPRCKASCVAITVAIALMLQGKYNLKEKKHIAAITERAIEEASKLIELEPQKEEMEKHIKSSLAGLKLDDRNTIGYTFKALGCGFYGLRQGKDFKKIITEVIMEAGDADSNASVCGAVLGCKIGYSELPKDLLELKYKSWLDEKVNLFLKTTGLLE